MRRSAKEGAAVADLTPLNDVEFVILVSTYAMTRMVLYVVIYVFEAA
jgi:hypothetical protein